MVLFGSALTTVLAGTYFKDGIKRLIKSDIAKIPDKRVMLLDIDLRRKNLGNAPLVISKAIFR